MNDKNLYRGKRVDGKIYDGVWAFNGGWVIGDLIVSKDKYYIHPRANAFQVDGVLSRSVVMHEVKKESVGQFTGLKDKRGYPIFEGDVVADFVNDKILSVGDVQFKCGVFGVEWTHNKENRRMVGVFGQRHNLRRLDDDIMDDIEVIGNRFEFPELLYDL